MRFHVRIIISISTGVALLLGVMLLNRKTSQTADTPRTPATSIVSESRLTVGNSPSVSGLNNPAGADATPQVNSPGTLAEKSVAQGPLGVAPQAPSPLQPLCFIETYHHKPTTGHSDEESCSRHKNSIKLSHANVNPAHVCVRVNGTPVKYSREGADEILIGSIAGPKAKISVSYCVGKATCPEIMNEDCVIPKDEFMDALGGSNIDGAKGIDGEASGQWESSEAAGDSKLNSDVKKELADMDEVSGDEGESRAPAQAPIFKNWINDEDAPACTKKQSS